MADDSTKRSDGETAEMELDLDAQTVDLDSAMRDAVAAVEAVEDGGAQSGNGGGGGSEGSEVERLRREIADLRDRSMRTLADFDNFRKRSERERQEQRRYSLFEPMREFLGVVDNLELALSAQGSADDLKQGVEMILRQMQELLRRHGVREVPAAGAAFDPAVHEAVSREEDPNVQAPTVTAELRRGYQMHDRLLRPAMVRVAVPAETPQPAESGE
ncbi:MAG TPA: nucleotide exchange factor GrpE [Thermoanaerobaculia bacterium]|nr:nucleotide exchange factor GrpE [Thermoanaerobaculia bacterium]